MSDWRDLLQTLRSVTEDPGALFANGVRLTDDVTFTDYGHAYFQNEMNILRQCMEGVEEEIRFLQGLIDRDEEDDAGRAELAALMDRAQRNREQVLDYKRWSEAFYNKFASAPEFAEDED